MIFELAESGVAALAFFAGVWCAIDGNAAASVMFLVAAGGVHLRRLAVTFGARRDDDECNG